MPRNHCFPLLTPPHFLDVYSPDTTWSIWIRYLKGLFEVNAQSAIAEDGLQWNTMDTVLPFPVDNAEGTWTWTFQCGKAQTAVRVGTR